VKLHRGKRVEKAVRDSGFSITMLAKRLGVSRKTLYNYFEVPDLDFFIVSEIGQLIGNPFTDLLPEINSHHNKQELGENKGIYELYTTENTIEYWKTKYFTLLEKYTQLLESNSSKN
jgi:predicted transcriptional regulator